MTTLLVFALSLLIAVLLSELAGRSILSTAVLFLVAGFIAGPSGLNVIASDPRQSYVLLLAEAALCSVLFTDGMRASLKDIGAAWKLPGRALILGLPLTLFLTALLAHYVARLSWPIAFLIGAILSPTDPVFAAAIVGRKEVPQRLRFLLNVESGINDGLALPIVLALLGFVGQESSSFFQLGGELLWGVAIGVLVPIIVCWIEGRFFLAIAKPYEPLFAFAVGLLVLGIAGATHGNIYLAAFAGGSTIASTRPDLRDEFHQFGELIAELLKLAAILVFGATIAPAFFSDINFAGYLFAILALILARPAALLLALAGSALDWRERIVAAWFGPKGFASVIYALLLFTAQVPDADHIFHLIAIVIAGSMIAHSSTDVLVVNWFEATAARERETAMRSENKSAK